MSHVLLKIKRQDDFESTPYWEVFEIRGAPGMTVISALNAIRRRSVNQDGFAVSPVVWDCNCLEEKCGACTMIINGKVRLACTALIEELNVPIVLEPLTKFKVIRDLVVDRSKIQDTLGRIRGWQQLDKFEPLGRDVERPKIDDPLITRLADCIYCGACLEACPQYNETSNYVGALAVSQTLRHNQVGNGSIDKTHRLNTLMDVGGISECKNVQNCRRACPKNIPTTEAIGKMKRRVFKGFMKRVLG